MVKPIPTEVGDVLVLETRTPYTIYAVARVTKDGQQDCHAQLNVKYETDRATAVVEANAIVAPGRRMFLSNIDTGDWSEISRR